MATICPTVTAEDPHTYRKQLETLLPFADRIHLDFMDGLFTSNTSIDLHRAWTPDDKQIDLHLMYMRPDLYINAAKNLHPSLVIVHAEAEGRFDIIARQLHDHGIKVGVCVLQGTPVARISQSLDDIDHVLIFSGNLGHFGGKVDMNLLEKAKELKRLKPSLEIGWDGGVTDENAAQLAAGGIDVLNIGGFIQKASNPRACYDQLVSLVR